MAKNCFFGQDLSFWCFHPIIVKYWREAGRFFRQNLIFPFSPPGFPYVLLLLALIITSHNDKELKILISNYLCCREKTIYCLKSIILHTGHELHYGHYITYCKIRKDWILFDDSLVKKKDDATILPEVQRYACLFFMN